MATQRTLSWNGVTICTPSAGKSWYNVTEQHKKGNFFEFSFPNSVGRFKRLIGSENTADTSRTIEIAGTTFAANPAAVPGLAAIVTNIGAVLSGSSPHGILSYGRMDVTGEITEANMDCDFTFSESWRNGKPADNGEYFLNWTAVFTKWGA